MVACRYGFSMLVFTLTSHSFAALTRKLLAVKHSKRNFIFMYILMRAHVLLSI